MSLADGIMSLLEGGCDICRAPKPGELSDLAVERAFEIIGLIESTRMKTLRSLSMEIPALVMATAILMGAHSMGAVELAAAREMAQRLKDRVLGDQRYGAAEEALRAAIGSMREAHPNGFPCDGSKRAKS